MADLAGAVEALNKAYDGIIVNLSQEAFNKDITESGSLALDKALGGGIVRGRIIELYGGEAAGKTTLAIHMAVEAQKHGKIAYVDVEHSFDPVYASVLGLNMDELLFSQPNTMEEACTVMETLAGTGQVSFIVLDSVAALSPQAEFTGDSGDYNMGLTARLMGQHLRKVTPIAGKTKTTILYINQIRMKIGVVFGSPETTPGGRALKYYSSVRMDIRRIKTLIDGKGFDKENPRGIRCRVKVVKNKTAPPLRVAEFDINYGAGIDQYSDVFDIAIDIGIVEQKGSWFSYNDNKLGQGKLSVIETFKSGAINEKVYEEIRIKVYETVKGL